MKIQVVCVLLAFIGASCAFLMDSFRPSNWNDLKVTWGPVPFRHFNSMPRTVDDALEEGFIPAGGCEPGVSTRGMRYIKGGDKSLVLLFDVNGYIAGIQIVVPRGLPYNYPARGLTPPFVEHEDGYYLTAYFVPTETICTTGRTRHEFEEQGTGTVLIIQNGNNTDTDYMTFPHPHQESHLARTNWVRGKCFYTMGRHYWYNIHRDMDCDSFFPVFLMYNDDKLNGFGWALGADLPSPRLEHPNRRIFGLFMEDPPVCLRNRGTLSTMHIFLTSRPALNFC